MHISFSALDMWTKCPFSYKLKYIDQTPYDRGNLFSAFGHSIHYSINQFLTQKDIKLEETFKNTFRSELKELSNETKKEIVASEDLSEIIKNMSLSGGTLCKEAIDFLDIKFPNYKLIGSEIEFVDPIIQDFKNDYEFKGIIDLIIQTPDGINHIIDFKTTSWGWDPKKKNNKMVTYQLTYYKHFFCFKNNIDLDKTKTYFALIKRTAKKDRIEIFEVPVGKIKIKNAFKQLNKMIYNIESKFFPKNKTSCKFCSFYKTPHCPAK